MQKDRNTEKGSNIQTSVTHLKMSCEEDQKIFGQNQHQPVYTILTMRCEFEIFLTHMWVPNANTWDIDRFFLTNLPTANILTDFFFSFLSVGSNCKYMGYRQIGVRTTKVQKFS